MVLDTSISSPDHIFWKYLKLFIYNNTYLKKIVCITNTYINLEYWLFYFKSATTIVITKPNKDSYNIPKPFWPIVLLNMTGKLIEKVISNQFQFHMTVTPCDI